MDPIRVLIADDHPLFRAGLRTLIASEAGIEVVAEAATGVEAVELAETLRPGLVMMDLTMPDLDGIAATGRIIATVPDVAVLVLTMLEDPESLSAAMRAGARGYLVKGAGGEETLRAVRAVADGEVIFSAAVAQHVLDRVTVRDSPRVFPELSEREREVLALLAQGYTNSAIADRVFLTHKTVRNYISSIFRKLQVDDRPGAIIRAREAGLG